MVTDLGEQPTPEIEPAEPPPGGVDAVEEEQFESRPLVPDLTQVGNEPAKDAVPDEIAEPEATDTAATRGESTEPEEEAPA